MITLSRAIDDQKDLLGLCAKRGNPTVDAFRGNGFYGMADIYKSYAKLPINKPLNGIVPHGPVIDNVWLWKEEGNAPVPYVYCYPESRQEVYKRRTTKKVILSASPFLYAKYLLRDHVEPKREGTLFFPAHSSKLIRVEQDYAKMADELLSFDACYQPVHVCIYWKDLLMGGGKPFQSRGIPMVSAGHIYDRLFLYRLCHLFSQYQYISSNEMGSHLFYGVRSGCTYFHLDFECRHIASANRLKRDGTGIKSKRRDRLTTMFKTKVCEPTPQQKSAVDYYLGADYFKTSRELQKELLR